MALSYNLGYQESISVHPTWRQNFAGKPYSNFPNIWEWLVCPASNDWASKFHPPVKLPTSKVTTTSQDFDTRVAIDEKANYSTSIAAHQNIICLKGCQVTDTHSSLFEFKIMSEMTLLGHWNYEYTAKICFLNSMKQQRKTPGFCFAHCELI